MRRQVFKLAASVSLVLCVATVALWYVTYDWPRATFKAKVWDVSLGRGGLHFAHNNQLGDPRVMNWDIDYVSMVRSLHLPGLGFIWIRHDARLLEAHGSMAKGTIIPFSTNLVIKASYPELAVVFGAMPGLYGGLRGWAALRRWRYRGRCLVCGYDLRASPERCPECGTEVGRAPA